MLLHCCLFPIATAVPSTRLLTVCHLCPCSYLDIFKAHHHLWVCTSPVVICGFGVDRLKAEAMLGNQPQVIQESCSLLQLLSSNAALRSTAQSNCARAGSYQCAAWPVCPDPASDSISRTRLCTSTLPLGKATLSFLCRHVLHAHVPGRHNFVGGLLSCRVICRMQKWFVCPASAPAARLMCLNVNSHLAGCT